VLKNGDGPTVRIARYDGAPVKEASALSYASTARPSRELNAIENPVMQCLRHDVAYDFSIGPCAADATTSWMSVATFGSDRASPQRNHLRCGRDDRRWSFYSAFPKPITHWIHVASQCQLQIMHLKGSDIVPSSDDGHSRFAMGTHGVSAYGVCIVLVCSAPGGDNLQVSFTDD